MYNFLKLHKVATSTEKALGCAHEDFLFLNLYVQCLSNIVEAVENVQFFFLLPLLNAEMNAYFILFTLR